jgi:hypothetical protein
MWEYISLIMLLQYRDLTKVMKLITEKGQAHKISVRKLGAEKHVELLLKFNRKKHNVKI